MFFLIFNSAKATEAINQDVCGKKLYEDRIKLTEQRVVTKYQAPMILSPVKADKINGCVGISFSINQQGEAFDLEIIKVSEKVIFSRAAKKALKKYRFKKSSDVFEQGYLVIEFADQHQQL